MNTDVTLQPYRTLLHDGIEHITDVECTPIQQEKLVQFLQLLEKWNRTYNLTSITDWRDMVIKHLLDSLVIGPYLNGGRVLDVGTGAGIPGIPLAIVNPDVSFVLLDANNKKTRFMTQVKAELALSNIEIRHARIETFGSTDNQSPDTQSSDTTFDQIMCRAYSSISQFVTQTQHLKTSGTVSTEWLALKGQIPDTELADFESKFGSQSSLENSSFKNPLKVTAIHSLAVPFLDEQRHLIRIQETS